MSKRFGDKVSGTAPDAGAESVARQNTDQQTKQALHPDDAYLSCECTA